MEENSIAKYNTGCGECICVRKSNLSSQNINSRSWTLMKNRAEYLFDSKLMMLLLLKLEARNV